MIKASFFKRRNIVNARLFIISYVVSVLSVSMAIILTVGSFNYLNGKGLYYDDGFIIKTFELMALGGFFAILYSIVMVYSDKRKSIDLIFEFKQLYNESNYAAIQNFIKDMDEESMHDILIKIKKSKDFEGEVVAFDIQSIDITVVGINIKKIEYNIFCFFSHSSGKKEEIIFNFYTINNGSVKLHSLIYPTN